MTSDVWDFIGDGTVFGVSISVIVAIVIAVIAHIAITRSRPGWHILAVGGSRRSAYNSGIRVRETVFMTYVISGFCSGLAGFLIACRLSGAGPGTGLNLEIMALTAAVVGGNSLGGGRGSIAKGVMGAIIVLVMTNGLIRLGYGTGTNQMVLGLMLAAAVTLDIRWLKNRHKVLNEVYVAPIYHRMGETQSALPGSGTPYALDNRLAEATAIGLGELEGPEDVILDEDDHLYCGTRHGEIIRFFAPDYKRSEVFAHIGGFPLGLAFDRAGNLLSCVGAMGLYSITKSGEATKLSAETTRSWTSVVDDARLRDPNDCDVAPDGRIFFTDSTTRYDAHDWALDSIESRPTGRLLCYDPRSGKTTTLLDNYRYANGVCIAHDGQSLFFAESWACRVHRYWFDGPKAGQVECVIKDMPGYPDNINRASDGSYWMAWLGMRTPSFDLALRHPGDAQAHDPPPAPGRMAVSQHQYRRRGEVRRKRPHPRGPRRSVGRGPSDGHDHARAQGLSLYRRHPEQSRRPLPDPGRRSKLDRARAPIGGPANDLRSPARSLPRQGGHHSADGRRAAAEHGAGRGRGGRADRGAGQSLLRRQPGLLLQRSPGLRACGHDRQCAEASRQLRLRRSPPWRHRRRAIWRSRWMMAAFRSAPRTVPAPGGLTCPTALAFGDADSLYVCQGSARASRVRLGRRSDGEEGDGLGLAHRSRAAARPPAWPMVSPFPMA